MKFCSILARCILGHAGISGQFDAESFEFCHIDVQNLARTRLLSSL